MALVLADRVQETSITAGTGTLTLSGAVAGYQSFAAIGNANTTYYTITDPTTGDWEVGIGTYTTSGTTLSRTTVLSSSNAGSLVSFAANVKNVFCTYPAEKALYEDANGNIGLDATVNPSWDPTARSVVQLPGNNSIAVVTSNNNLHLLTNSYVDAGVSKYASTGFATQINNAQLSGSIGLVTYTSGTIGNAIATAASVQLTQTNFEMNTATGGIGYGVGSGGTVTQLTSKSTAVTLNKPTGQITMAASALAASAIVSFTLNNSLITANDTLVVSVGGTTGPYRANSEVSAGAAIIVVQNHNAGSLSEAIKINFSIIRGAIA